MNQIEQFVEQIPFGIHLKSKSIRLLFFAILGCKKPTSSQNLSHTLLPPIQMDTCFSGQHSKSLSIEFSEVFLNAARELKNTLDESIWEDSLGRVLI